MKLSQINIFPLKSARGIGCSSVHIGRFGPESDRRWMLVDGDGKFLSQRRFPRMALITVELTENGLNVSAPTMPVLQVSRPDDGQFRSVTVWKDNVQAVDAGDAAGHWFSEFLAVPCRLVYMPDDAFRAIDRRYLDRLQPVSFADGFPFLLISEASLEDLNSRLTKPVEMKRFRPNLVVSDCEPFAEDQWSRIRIGSMVFDVVKPCTRCIITTIDPLTGERGEEPLRTLSGYRKNEFGVCFGQNLVHQGEGVLYLGDEVEILR